MHREDQQTFDVGLEPNVKEHTRAVILYLKVGPKLDFT